MRSVAAAWRSPQKSLWHTFRRVWATALKDMSLMRKVAEFDP
jgi:hypothetical protein